MVGALLYAASCSAGSGGAGGDGALTGAGTINGFGAVKGTGTSAPINDCAADDCVREGEQQPCDDGLPIDGADAMDGVRAIGLCKRAADGWGAIDARYTTADGQPLTGALAVGRGVLPSFGPSVAPREGQRLLALSSGAARTPTDPGYASPEGHEKSGGAEHAWPSGFTLQESPKCSNIVTGEPYDSAMLEVRVKTPTNARSITFDIDFYTYEFPEFICSSFNDYFVALMSPAPAGSIQGNVSFDAQHNFISVNAGFLQACDAQEASNGELYPCALGYAEILGSGYDDALVHVPGLPRNSASTSWLQTVAPIEAPGAEITLRFAIWDSGDEALDSTILIDNLRFSLAEGTTETTPVPR